MKRNASFPVVALFPHIGFDGCIRRRQALIYRDPGRRRLNRLVQDSQIFLVSQESTYCQEEKPNKAE